MSYFLIYLIKSTVYLGLFYAFFLVAMRFLPAEQGDVVAGNARVYALALLYPYGRRSGRHATSHASVGRNARSPGSRGTFSGFCDGTPGSRGKDIHFRSCFAHCFVESLFIRGTYLSDNAFPFVQGSVEADNYPSQAMERRLLARYSSRQNLFVQLG